MVYVPSAFTPDGDMVNEVLRIEASCPISGVHLEIFDRWGQKVHEAHSLESRWNGGVSGYFVDTGVYHYRLTFKWGAEGAATGVPEWMQGSILVIR
jgi:gliding motility-associated-like protein